MPRRRSPPGAGRETAGVPTRPGERDFLDAVLENPVVREVLARAQGMIAPRHVYETKAARWKGLWPRLVVLPWPDDAGAGRPRPRPGTVEANPTRPAGVRQRPTPPA